MVTEVWHIGSQMETGKQSIRISEIEVVNPSASLVSRASHQLLEAKVIEGGKEETVWIFVQAEVHVSRDGCNSLHVDHLLQVLHQLLLTSIG